MIILTTMMISATVTLPSSLTSAASGVILSVLPNMTLMMVVMSLAVMRPSPSTSALRA